MKFAAVCSSFGYRLFRFHKNNIIKMCLFSKNITVQLGYFLPEKRHVFIHGAKVSVSVHDILSTWLLIFILPEVKTLVNSI